MRAPTFAYDRPLTDDEKALVNHVSMWGSDGYPVQKVGSRHWHWSFRSLEAPVVFPTKRAATQSFETFMEVLHECLRADSYRRALAELGR